MVKSEKEIIKFAIEAMKHAYAPYSNFHVGACVAMRDGAFIIGANIENASYGLCNCAERSALFAAYSQGYRKDDITGMAIVCDGELIASPCGACRQVMVELLHQDTPIYLSNTLIERTTTIAELLPMSFTSEDLHHV